MTRYTKIEVQLFELKFQDFLKTNFKGKIWNKIRLVEHVHLTYKIPVRVILNLLAKYRKADKIKYYFRYEPITHKYVSYFVEVA